MNDRPHVDPYQLRPEDSRDPPHRFVDTIRMIGPGLILAGGLVGSGELVATTVLGAENGYRLLWLILVSCTIKTVVQNELGRYAIGTGETTLEAFNRVPGPLWVPKTPSAMMVRVDDWAFQFNTASLLGDGRCGSTRWQVIGARGTRTTKYVERGSHASAERGVVSYAARV